MRIRAGFILLLFAWHLAIPVVTLAAARASLEGGAVTASNESGGSSSWLPRSVSVDDLARLPERQSRRLPLDRFVSGRQPRNSACYPGRRPNDLHRRSSYPARSLLHRRLSRCADDGPPA